MTRTGRPRASMIDTSSVTARLLAATCSKPFRSRSGRTTCHNLHLSLHCTAGWYPALASYIPAAVHWCEKCTYGVCTSQRLLQTLDRRSCAVM